jgi:ABC-2 type transport system permease protein
VTVVHSMAEAKTQMLNRKVDGVLRIQSDFARRGIRAGQKSRFWSTARTRTRRASCKPMPRGRSPYGARRRLDQGAASAGPVIAVDRMWFNESNDSHYFLVPGLIVLVMTIIGAFLTAMVVAREWERGTLEALFVTPMRPGEFLISKLVPYFGLGMIGFVLCLLAGQFLFHVPLRGSLFLLCLASMIYLLVALGIGLLVSTLVKSQFLASQLAMTLTSDAGDDALGFSLRPAQHAGFHSGNHLRLPARYAVTLMQTLYLAGDVGSVVWPNLGVLAAMAATLLVLTRLATRKQLS